MTPEEIRAAIEYLDACLRDLTIDADGNVRSVEAGSEAETQFNEGMALREQYVADLARHNQLADLAAVPEARQHGTGQPETFNVNTRTNPLDLDDIRLGTPASDLRARAASAIESIRALPDADRESATRTLERTADARGSVALRMIATGSDEYRSAFQKVAAGRGWALTADEQQSLERAQSLSDAAGGYAVPFTLDPTIILTNAGIVNPLRRIANVKQITTDSWNGVSSAGATASYGAEAAEVSDDAITLAQPTVPVHRLDVFIPFSFEIEGDWAGIESDLRMVMVDAKEREEGSKMVTGSGTNQPTGFVTALDGTSAEISPTTGETFAVADVYKVEEALTDRFRANARWGANRAIYNDIRQFDTSGGASLWERLGAGLPPELIGYPAEVISSMDSGFNAAATADNFILVLGDWSNFVIADRVGMNIELVPHLFATGNNRPSGQRGFLAWCRNGSDVITPDGQGFALLNVATTA